MGDSVNNQNRHGQNCCCFSRNKYPWIKYIKPASLSFLAFYFIFSMSTITNYYEDTSRDLVILSGNLQGVKMDTVDIVRGLEITNDVQKVIQIHLKNMSILLIKIADLTNQIMVLHQSAEEENLRLLSLLKTTEQIEETIKKEISEYNADKTARSDFALESAGGKILSIRSTRPYIVDTGSFFSRSWHYVIRLKCNPAESARPILQPSVHPGQCWAFEGSVGTVVVQLVRKIYITGLTLEHIPATISHTQEISSAPKTVSLWGIDTEDEQDGYFFGEFIYRKDAEAVQYFDVQYQSRLSFDIIQLKIHSNWGNPDYTCVYRLRIHGVVENSYNHL